MNSSIFIAKLIGPILVVTGLMTLANPKALQEIAREFLASRALLFVAGSLALLAGLAIVNSHNIWIAGWPVIITLFGWMAIVAGLIRMAFPAVTKSIAEAMLSNFAVLRVVGGLQVALGAYLMTKGYL